MLELRSCRVSYQDSDGIGHSVEVTAETLYEAAILGMTLFNVSDADMKEIHAGLLAGLANGTLKPVIGRELPLAEAAAAHKAVMEPGALGKLVLVP